MLLAGSTSGGRESEAVQRCRVGEDAAAVAGDVRVDPVLVDVAVEDLPPVAAAREADAVVEAVERSKVHDHHHVVAFALDPAVEREHAVLIVDVHHAETLARASAGCRQRSAEQLAREPQVVEHLLVARVESRPVEQQVRDASRSRRTTACPPGIPAP